ncbi:MAG: hypothetical protein R3F55_12255 [Alphaproteobacteria bacterium]
MAAIALLAGPARAEGDVEAARPIIADRCTVCHHVPGYPAPQYTAGGAAASFQDIADGSQYDTPEKLTAFLHQPHFIIPGFSLSDEDIDNLVAFIVALRHE